MKFCEVSSTTKDCEFVKYKLDTIFRAFIEYHHDIKLTKLELNKDCPTRITSVNKDGKNEGTYTRYN
jgi:hypothetical protein